MSLLALATLLLPLAAAAPCVQFDTAWNLYAFGGDQDVNLGPSSSWSSPNAQPLTTNGRPPWTGNTTQCFLSQDNNAMYVLGADASDVSKIYVYSFSGNSWTTQATSSAPPNLGSRSASIIDHDTNVIFTLSSGSGQSLYSVDLSSIKDSASGSAIAWESVVAPPWASDSYTPTAAPAANHINYFGVPNTAAGSADLFVIHYAYFQPQSQAYGGNFPDSSGQAFSILSDSTIPYQSIFIPDDFSNSYVVTHWTDLGDYSKTDDAPFAQSLINSTQTLPAPSSQDPQAAYAGSPSALVQVDSKGDIYYMLNPINNYNVNSGATWAKLGVSLSGLGGSSSSPSGSASASASASATGGASAASGASSGRAGASGSAASGGASASSAPSGAASSTLRFDIIGLALGLVAAGAAVVL